MSLLKNLIKKIFSNEFTVSILCLLQLSCANVESKSVVDNTQSRYFEDKVQDYFIVDSSIPPILNPQAVDSVIGVQQTLFSISLSDIPVKDFLHALALDADIDLLMNDGLSGSVSLQLLNKSLPEILDAVALQLSIRYELSASVLQVFPDNAYLKTYAVDYLNVQRSAGSDIDLSTQIGAISLGTESTGTSAGNNSRATVKNLSVNDFWLTLQSNLTMMVSLENKEADSSVIVNRETGFVSVYGTQKLQKKVANYIKRVVKSAQRQVLIEALVIELVLNDKFQAGVDWRVLSNGGENGNFVQNFSGGPTVTPTNIQDIAAPNALFSLFKNSSSGNNISATLKLLSEFGEVNILSSPKINALNNQTAVLKVVDNRVYFALDVKKVVEDDVETLTTTSEIKTVPIGLVMNVLPFISEDKDIILNIRPTISRILGFVADPNPSLASAGVQNLVPEIQVRELESVLRVRSGGLVVIGGLMQNQISEKEVSVPGLSWLPGIGHLFRYQSNIKTKTELLVLLRPSVIDDQRDYNNSIKPYLN